MVITKNDNGKVFYSVNLDNNRLSKTITTITLVKVSNVNITYTTGDNTDIKKSRFSNNILHHGYGKSSMLFETKQEAEDYVRRVTLIDYINQAHYPKLYEKFDLNDLETIHSIISRYE